MSIETRTRTGAPHRSSAAGGLNAGLTAGTWGRRRLVVVLVGMTLAAAVLVAGLGYVVYLALGPTRSGPSTGGTASTPYLHESAPTSTGPARGSKRRDAIAAAPMLPVPPEGMRPIGPVAVPAPTIAIPIATRRGAVTVPTGFPHTPMGAVGQLAGIETTVLQRMSIAVTNEVYDAWVMPDPHTDSHAAPSADSGIGADVGVSGWELTQDVQAFLGSTSSGPEKAPTTTVVATPAGALVKGTDGPDWTLACVLMQLRATVATDAQIGYGYCARMQWNPTATPTGGAVSTQGRWMIAPGTAPAKAPSTWPGSELSIKAGWHTWTWDTATSPAADAGSTGTAGSGSR